MKKVVAVLSALVCVASFADETPRASRATGSPVTAELSRTARVPMKQANDPHDARDDGRQRAAGTTQSRTATSRQTADGAIPDAQRTMVQRSASTTSITTRSGPTRATMGESNGRAVIERINAAVTAAEEGRRTTTRRARAATDNPFVPDTTPVEAPSSSEDLAACSASYFDCLNQFCNVLDQNQKQCSCSGRLSQYKKTEESLQKANEELNAVANQIRYVGLSADEVRSIMRETEAETVLSSVDDRTQSRRMLEEIEKIIRSPTGDVTSGGGSSAMLNFELDFSGGAFDLNSLFGGDESFANMRGTDLYSAAKKKCGAILTRCAPKKADQGIISGQYDIEIDKACITYEAGLKKATDGVKANVRTATQMLQKARLTVLENNNLYDAKGCVGALDACMRDEMVCGDNYYKCLDPTKTAINESGTVIPGGDVVRIQELLTHYDSTCLDNAGYNWTKSSARDCGAGMTTNQCGLDGNGARAANKNDGQCVISYILSKIGKSDGNGKVLSGFCRPVLDKCRQYTYTNGQYVENNTIVRSYIERVMTQLRAAQSSIISEYASVCIHDVSACYNSQLTQVNSYSGGISLSPSTVRPILMGACRNVAAACAFAIFSDKSMDTSECWDDNGNRNTDGCINKLSEMFYQAMLCPANSTWDSPSSPPKSCSDTTTTDCIGENNRQRTAGTKIYVNSNCVCNVGFYVQGGQCVATPICPANSGYDADEPKVKAGTATDSGVPIPFCKCQYAGVSVIAGNCPTSAPITTP